MLKTCTICKKKILDGEARYTITEDHYYCTFPQGQKTLKELCAEMDKAADGLLQSAGISPPRKKRVREGEGATALRCKAWAKVAIELHLGEEIEIGLIWNQQGAYRGPRWDLDAWGVDFIVLGHRDLRGSASSLATMTACIKAGGLKASQGIHTRLRYALDLYPK